MFTTTSPIKKIPSSSYTNTATSLICAFSITLASAKESKPNILLILSDDAGYADFGYTNSGLIQTPNINSLASNGVRFDAGYVTASVCSPSRAGLLTGRYQQRFGHEYNIGGKVIGDNPEVKGMAVEEKTMADYMKQLGYSTACFGKWHLGDADKYHPNNRGFDYFYGSRAGSFSYFTTKGIEEQMTKVPKRDDIYMTDHLTDKAIDWMGKQKDKPFFIYMAYNAPHTPLHAKKEHLEKYSYLATNDPKKQATLAMTESLDENIGKLMSYLKKSGQYDNTLVIFLNDNGGQCDTNHANNAPYNGMKGTLFEGGVRVPFIIQWPKKIKAGTVYKPMVSALDLLPTFIASAQGRVEIPAKQPLDGSNLIPYLEGAEGVPHDSLYWRRSATAAIRNNEWKLIRLPNQLPRLYNLNTDISEQHSLTLKNPEKAQDLLKKLNDWEATLSHPRWRTGYMWRNRNINRYAKKFKLTPDKKSEFE